MTTLLNLVLIFLAAIQAWLAWTLLQPSVPSRGFKPFPV
jgi:hypothetical protein